MGLWTPSFGNTGFVKTSLGGQDEALSIGVLTDGRFVVMGKSGNAYAAARYERDGAPDSSFNGSGKALVSPGSSAAAQSGALQSDNRILITGYILGSGNDIATRRFNADGSLDGF